MSYKGPLEHVGTKRIVRNSLCTATFSMERERVRIRYVIDRTGIVKI